jgi:hypothetical protein
MTRARALWAAKGLTIIDAIFIGAFAVTNSNIELNDSPACSLAVQC